MTRETYQLQAIRVQGDGFVSDILRRDSDGQRTDLEVRMCI